MENDILDVVVDKGCYGIEIIGTCLVYVSSYMFPALQRTQEEKIPICMVVEPLFDSTNLRV